MVFFTAPVWLTALAIGVAALTVVAVAALAFADTGKKDWGDVVRAVVDLGLTLVGGRLASIAFKGVAGLTARVAVRVGDDAASATRAAWQARLASWPQFQNASRITNPANNLARWTQGVRANMATAIQSADDAGRAGVHALENVSTSTLRRLAFLDADLARGSSTLAALRDLGLQGGEVGLAASSGSYTAAAAIANWAGMLSQAQSGVGTVADSGDALSTLPWSTRP